MRVQLPLTARKYLHSQCSPTKELESCVGVLSVQWSAADAVSDVKLVL